jgi:hypothetical protein
MIIHKKLKYKKIIYFLLILSLASSCAVKRDITENELRKHIKFLSSEALEGRMTGTAGDSLAAVYIKKQLSAYGLVPLSGDGFERFKYNNKVSLGKGNAFSADGISYTIENDFSPTAFSENGVATGEVVFAGYGFRINNDSLKWDDYKDIDVRNKWVMILRSSPDLDDPSSKFATFISDRNKAMIVKDLGAAGVLLVSTEAFDKEDRFDPLSKGGYSVGIPVICIKRRVADAILSKSDLKISSLTNKLNTSAGPASFLTGATVQAESDIIKNMVGTRNVVMLLPGEDMNLKNEYLIFGAHFDHLGMGGPGSGSRAVDTVGVHHGADDNASGVALVIELAGKFAGTKTSNKRSMIFMAFSGEEEGLLGSKHFVDNPLIDLSKTNAMINLDMVGRLSATKNLQVGGVGTADGLKEKANAVVDTNNLKLAFTEDGAGASDHSAFYAKNMPVIYFTTGTHGDYHTPADTWDKINYPGMVNIGELIFNMTSSLANDSARLKFKESAPQTVTGAPPRRRGITLGIMPDVTGSISNGLKVEAVTLGRPAEAGGMKKGDIIISIDGKPVNNIGDYMFRMSQLKAGQSTVIEVMRNNKKEALVIQL